MLTANDLTIDEAVDRLTHEGYETDENGVWVKKSENTDFGDNEEHIALIVVNKDKFFIVYTTATGINY